MVPAVNVQYNGADVDSASQSTNPPLRTMLPRDEFTILLKFAAVNSVVDAVQLKGVPIGILYLCAFLFALANTRFTMAFRYAFLNRARLAAIMAPG